MHPFTSDGASGKCISSTCIISKLVRINSQENKVHELGTIERISLNALASWETPWTSESVFPRGHAGFYFTFIYKAKTSYSTWAIASGAWFKEIPQDCCMLHKTKRFPKMTLLSVSVSLSGWSLCRAGLCPFLRQYHTWEKLCAGKGCHCSPGCLCWVLLLVTCTCAANTEGPQTPNIAFSFHPATAELTDWCTNLVCRCLCCLRRAFHLQ